MSGSNKLLSDKTPRSTVSERTPSIKGSNNNNNNNNNNDGFL